VPIYTSDKMVIPAKVLRPRAKKNMGLKLTRPERLQLRSEMGLLGASGKGARKYARRRLAGLRRTGSGIETKKAQKPFVLQPSGAKAKRSASETAKWEQKKQARKNLGKRGGKHGTAHRQTNSGHSKNR